MKVIKNFHNKNVITKAVLLMTIFLPLGCKIEVKASLENLNKMEVI